MGSGRHSLHHPGVPLRNEAGIKVTDDASPNASSESLNAYVDYLERGWPGTAILIDTDEPALVLRELLADLNPLCGGEVSGSPAARL